MATPNNLDIERFYLCCAGHFISVPDFLEYINDKYESQKIRFYNKARGSTHYDAFLMRSHLLADEVAMKRTYSILLCSLEDDELAADICNNIIKCFPLIKTLLSDFSLKASFDVTQTYYNEFYAQNASRTKMNSIQYFMGFVLIHKYGLTNENPDLQSLYSILAADLWRMDDDGYEEFKENINSIKIHDLMVVPRYVRKLKEVCVDREALEALFRVLERIGEVNIKPFTGAIYNQIYASITPYLEVGLDDYRSSWYFASMIAGIMDLQGMSLGGLVDAVTFTKEELDAVFKILANSIKNAPNATARFDRYLVGIYCLVLVKCIKQNRDFYFTNNSETQFNELRRSEERIADLVQQLQAKQDEIDDIAKHNDVLQAQIKQYVATSSKDITEATKPLHEEIALLRSQIEKLQTRLAAEEEKNNELNRLREFAFAIEQKSEFTEPTVPLATLIKGKSIYVIGGHINWRNKLKEAHPQLNIIDGHNVSFDEQQLINADFVLLNTGNMSHKMYYKIIDVLRKNKVPFDYLGKYVNQNLLEQEITEILLSRAQ